MDGRFEPGSARFGRRLRFELGREAAPRSEGPFVPRRGEHSAVHGAPAPRANPVHPMQTVPSERQPDGVHVHTVLFLGGNGHAAGRLDLARAALAEQLGPVRIDLVDIEQPGFEDRAAAPDLDAFLDAVAADMERRDPDGTACVYATGIGALTALALRARGVGVDRPLLIQGAVLWGLERRTFPRLMRGPLPHLLQRAFRLPFLQRRFARKQFRRTLTDAERAAFFDGYARCPAFPRFFRWFTPGFLRELERAFAARPGALAGISVWWGGADAVVGTEELALTQERLGTQWPLRVFPHWGHYPMLDAPEEWAQALSDAVATAARR